jgi:hypothetical protein
MEAYTIICNPVIDTGETQVWEYTSLPAEITFEAVSFYALLKFSEN